MPQPNLKILDKYCGKPELYPFLRVLDGYQATLPVRCALRLAPLVFVRPGEPRRAEWADIDREGAEWRYTVTKTNTPHVRASCVAARARTPCGCRPVRSNP